MAEMELAGVNLPYSLDAEQSVLGAILLDGNANMPKASAKLHPEHFYVKVHTDIYTVMMQMFAASDNIDVVTVLENCMKNNVFESQEEGRNYLVKLMETVPSISSIDRYIEIVEDKYTRRLLISIAGDILENANEGQTDTAALLELAEKRNTVPFRLLLQITCRLVSPAVSRGNRNTGNLFTARHISVFRIAAEIADDNDLVDRCHDFLLMGMKGDNVNKTALYDTVDTKHTASESRTKKSRLFASRDITGQTFCARLSNTL